MLAFKNFGDSPPTNAKRLFGYLLRVNGNISGLIILHIGSQGLL